MSQSLFHMKEVSPGHKRLHHEVEISSYDGEVVVVARYKWGWQAWLLNWLLGAVVKERKHA